MQDKNNIVRMNEKLVKNEKTKNTIITKILQISVNICTFFLKILFIFKGIVQDISPSAL